MYTGGYLAIESLPESNKMVWRNTDGEDWETLAGTEGKTLAVTWTESRLRVDKAQIE